MTDQATNVIAMKARAAPGNSPPPKTILERVYAAGSLPIPAGDLATKTAAVMLQALGLLVIFEILADGTPRRIDKGQARGAMDRPWRLAKPAFSGEIGIPDGTR
ncbi:hypothetical protein [Microvirga antarctica]|uniref:hypothetical protein n=1 Tax=Microvirga antarctica TaxID=2819233 RepID=UPI001B30D006|nr:hypothetical protein [Microvirga antarctica]